MTPTWPLPGGQPVLETARLRLRPLREDDAETVFAWASDPEVTRFVGWPRHRSLEDSRAFLRDAVDGGPLAWAWGLELKEDGRLVGSTGLHDWNPDTRCAETGYVLARAHWGRGLASETLAAMAELGFRTLGAHRLEAFCYAANAPSRRVLEKGGFACEGIHRDRAFAHGRYWDLCTYARLAEDLRS